MQCSRLGLGFPFIVYSHVDIDTDAHNNHTGDTKTKRIHQTLSPKKTLELHMDAGKLGPHWKLEKYTEAPLVRASHDYVSEGQS